ncbi:hypothetical protein [Shewanella polaris]|uniref:Uncharacterized protein n=1 Tax=Shewanella polaris TaxID=2588449 RepID=A0A4Y5YBH8_9GAMM|nr:hypothetical protein [Shewanella polaris]QDE30140.1 hypothetical protein FH971_03605 [Shewanella polaris]
MKDIFKFKLMVVLMIILTASGCSKHPDTVAIDTSTMPKGVEISSTAYIFNSELASLAEGVKKIGKFNSRNSDVISGNVVPSFSVSNDSTNEYMTALNEVKAIHSSIPSKVQKAQTEKVAIEEGKIAEIQSNIDQQNALQAKLDNFTKAERGLLADINKEIEDKQQVLKQQQTKIIHVVNNYIVSNKLPIKKLDENANKPFNWDTLKAYKGKCSERKGRYYTEGTSHLSQCLYFNLNYKLSREQGANELGQVVKANINSYIEADWSLKMSVGDKHGLYRKKIDAEKSLQQAIVIAENQTDISKNTIERTLRTLNRNLERAKKSLVNVNNYPVTENDILRQNQEYSNGLNRMDKALSAIKRELLKGAIENGILVEKAPVIGTEGELPSNTGDYLLMDMLLNVGYIKKSSYGFTNLNQEWQDKVYLDKNTAVFGSSSSVDDDLSALELAVVAMNKYQRKHESADNGNSL